MLLLSPTAHEKVVEKASKKSFFFNSFFGYVTFDVCQLFKKLGFLLKIKFFSTFSKFIETIRRMAWPQKIETLRRMGAYGLTFTPGQILFTSCN
jgi:hypothetical protein